MQVEMQLFLHVEHADTEQDVADGLAFGLQKRVVR
jgi:hypothetical protein